MDWDDLRIFLAVARHESLSAAGRALKVDPATVGRRIARLEDAIGTRLFAKGPQGYALTDEGARLLTHAERAEAAMEGAAEALTGPEGLTGQIRIGAPDGCANYLLPQVLARICDANPGLEVQVVALPRVFNLSKREADMAIAVSRPSRFWVSGPACSRRAMAAHCVVVTSGMRAEKIARCRCVTRRSR